MAFQPEVVSYDAGVYQLEVIDPVDGGVGAVSNKPLLNLANRTAYLYQHVTNLENGTTIPPTVAPLNNANLTGTPTAPTPALGDNSTKISTTAFVQGTVNGLASVNVAGGANVTLTAVQAGNGILVFTGALTANIAVIVPNSTKTMIVENLTSGAFTLTVKTAAGTGVAVTQGKTQELFCDGTNVLLSSSDFVNMAMTGTTTAATPAVGDQSTKVATTNFVYQITNGVVTVPVGGGANVTLTAAQYGNGILLLTGALTASINVWVPAQGGTYILANNTTGAFSVNIGVNGGGTKALVPQGQSVVAYCDGTNVVLAGAAATSSFANYSFTATAAQTVFNAPYTPGNILVLVNGAAQDPADITATNGSSVTLTGYNNGAGCAVGDNVRILAFNSFTVANALTLAGGTMTGPILHVGGDTGVTPAQFNSSTLLATTAFVKMAQGNASNMSVLSAATTLTAANAGSIFSLNSGSSITLPLISTCPAGTAFWFRATASVSISVQGTDTLYVPSTSTTAIALGAGDNALIVSQGPGLSWEVIAGSALLPYSALFGVSLATNGYQKLPGGLIIQWGQSSVSTTGTALTFPLAFPNIVLATYITLIQSSSATTAYASTGGTSRTGMTIYCNTSTNTANWFAIGY